MYFETNICLDSNIYLQFIKITVCLEVMEIAAGGYAETKVTLYSFEFGAG